MPDAGDMQLSVEVVKGVAAKIVQAVVGFVGVVLFARILGPTGFGGFYLLLSLTQIVDRPIDGWTTAVKKRFTEVETDPGEVVGSQLLMNLAVSIVVVVGLLAFGDRLVSYTGLPDAPALFFLLFVTITLFYPFNRLVSAVGKVGASTWIDTVRSLLTFPFQLAFVLAGFGAAGMAFGLSAATVVCLPLSQYYVRTWPTLPSRETLTSVWRYARYSIVATFVGKAYDRFDVLLLGFVLAPAAAGYYEAAIRLTVPATFVANITGSALMPKVSHHASRGEAFAQDVTNSLAFGSVLSIPLFFGALAVGQKVVVTLYSGDYRAAAPLLVGLALYRVFRTQSKLLEEVVNGIDRPDANVKISGTTLAFNVVLGVVLVFQIGALGVVVATAAAEGLRYLLAAVVVRRELPAVDVVSPAIYHQIAAGVVMFGVVAVLRTVVPITGWVTLVVVVGTGAAVYWAVLYLVSRPFRVTVESVTGVTLPLPW